MIFHHVNKLLSTRLETRSAFPMTKARNRPMWINIFGFRSLRNQRAVVTSPQGLSHFGMRCVSLSHEKLCDWWGDILSSGASSLWSALWEQLQTIWNLLTPATLLKTHFHGMWKRSDTCARASGVWPRCTNYMQETDVINDGFVHRSK